MSSSSGSSTTTNTQPYIMSGPTQLAAQEAAQSQIGAAQIAAQAATTNTNSAIQALMGQYNTALTYDNPIVNTGNQATAQMNYMLGLPAVSPGAAPTAPTMGTPTTPTQAQIEQYITPNVAPVYYDGKTVTATPNGDILNQYTGPGATDNVINNGNGTYTINPGFFGNGVPAGAQQAANGMVTVNQSDLPSWMQGIGSGEYGSIASLSQSPNNDALYQSYINTQEMPGLQNTYNQQMQTYNTQLNQYNNEKALYDQYNAKGTASSQDISNIITNQPGFQFTMNQGINAIQNAASAKGMLNSGNLLQSLNDYGQGLAQQYYQNYMGNLATLAGYGNTATANNVSSSMNLANQIAGQYTNLGNTQANSALSAGNALASSYLLPVANQQVSMTPYTTTSSTNSSSSGFSGGLGDIGSLGSLL